MSIIFKGQLLQGERVYADSFHVPNFAQRALKIGTVHLWDAMKEEFNWTDPADPNMRYRGNELSRQKAFAIWPPDTEPIVYDRPPRMLRKYRYPGFQHGSMLEYRDGRSMPHVNGLLKTFNTSLTYNGQPVEFNHVIGTCYRDEDDNIGFHHDKTRDITPNTPIVSLSLGETREFHLDRIGPDGKPQHYQTIVLKPGDLFILGPETNRDLRHAVVPVKDERVLQRDPSVEIGPRISLVFRDICTSITLAEVRKKADATEYRRLQKKLAKMTLAPIKKRATQAKKRRRAAAVKKAIKPSKK